MRYKSAVVIVALLIGGGLTWTVTGIAQEISAPHTHVLHVLDAFGPTPDGQGLLPTALAEAQIAAEHARLAAGNPTDMDVMIRHTRHVLNAIDPSEFGSGPGLGFGVRPAAEGMVQHIELARGADGASASVQTHSVHVAAAGRAVSTRADEAIDVARQILAAGVYNRAYPLVERLGSLCQELLTGVDSSGDGSVSLEAGEEGLEQAQQHMELLAQAEGLG